MSDEPKMWGCAVCLQYGHYSNGPQGIKVPRSLEGHAKLVQHFAEKHPDRVMSKVVF